MTHSSILFLVTIVVVVIIPDDLPTNQPYRQKRLIWSDCFPFFHHQKPLQAPARANSASVHGPHAPPYELRVTVHLEVDPDNFYKVSLALLHLLQIGSKFLFSTHKKWCSSSNNPFSLVCAIFRVLQELVVAPNDSFGSKNIFTNYVTSPLSTEKLTRSNYDNWVDDIKLWVQGQSYKDHLTIKSDTVVAVEKEKWEQMYVCGCCWKGEMRTNVCLIVQCNQVFSSS